MLRKTPSVCSSCRLESIRGKAGTVLKSETMTHSIKVTNAEIVELATRPEVFSEVVREVNSICELNSDDAIKKHFEDVNACLDPGELFDFLGFMLNGIDRDRFAKYIGNQVAMRACEEETSNQQQLAEQTTKLLAAIFDQMAEGSFQG